jgi:hypothetical protein
MLSNVRAIHITRFDTNRSNEFEAAFITNEKFVRLIWWFVNVNCVSWIELKLGQKIKKFRPFLLFFRLEFALHVRIGNIYNFSCVFQ